MTRAQIRASICPFPRCQKRGSCRDPHDCIVQTRRPHALEMALTGRPADHAATLRDIIYSDNVLGLYPHEIKAILAAIVALGATHPTPQPPDAAQGASRGSEEGGPPD